MQLCLIWQKHTEVVFNSVGEMRGKKCNGFFYLGPEEKGDGPHTVENWQHRPGFHFWDFSATSGALRRKVVMEIPVFRKTETN